MRVSIKIEKAKEYRLKYGMDMPTLKLARLMYNNNNLLFKDIEDARKKLRYIEGKVGTKNRQEINDERFILKEERAKNPYNLPESDANEFIPYTIKGHSRGVIFGDLHFPYQSNEAITAAFTSAKKFNPDFVFLNGDVLDFYGVSYFCKDPRKRTFAAELKIFKDFFIVLQKTFKCKIYFKFGNHEERYDKFLFQKAGELVGVEEFELENIIKARAEGIEVIKDKRMVVMNGLPFIHGHEFGRGVFSPVNAARGLFLQAKHSCVKGDCHTTSHHVEPNIFSKIMTTYSHGCLCDLHPEFLPFNKWNNGYMEIELDSNGKEYEIDNKSIYNGKVY